MSAALAAVVDTATAKRVEDRYADDAELIADLEDVLAIETARAGSATGEVTSVLRTLPSQAASRVPFRVRHRVWAVLLVLLVLALVGGGIAWLATRTHHNAPKLAAPPPGRHLVQVAVCPHCAYDYNPDALTAPKNQNPGLDGFAVDGDRNTAWATQHYYNGKLGKAGVGLYVDALQPVQARKLADLHPVSRVERPDLGEQLAA